MTRITTLNPRKFVLALLFMLASSAGVAQTNPTVTTTMNTIFSMAEQKLPEYFGGGAVTAFYQGYVYRLYTSGVHLGFANDRVYLLGGAFGHAVVEVGTMSFVLSELEKMPVPNTGNPGTSPTLWNLTISGTFNSSFVQNIAFSGISVANVPAPDLNNTSAINQEINTTLSGVATGISNIVITVINNTSNRRTFDVRFNATLTGLGAVSYNLRYDYQK